MNRDTLVAVIGTPILIALSAYLMFFAPKGEGKPTAKASGSLCASIPAAASGLTNDSITQLKIEDTKEGKGAQALTSNTVKMNYVGRLVDGKEFDSSCKEGRDPFEFTLGQGQVIAGWDSGIVGMKVGGQRRLIIPAALAYGERSPSPDIPENSALIFDVELLEVQ